MNSLTCSAPLHRLWLMILALVVGMLAGCSGGSADPEPVSISAQPVSTSVVTGTAASFGVSATGEVRSYQWQRSTDAAATWSAIVGATGASFDIARVDLSMNGQQYRVVITGVTGSITSSAVTLTVTLAPEPPLITVPPAPRSVTEGADATFAVTATGTDLVYQWQSSPDDATWANVAASNGATLTLRAVTLADNGKHLRVVVGNGGGSVTSASVLLTVIAAPRAPVITSAPLAASVIAPQSASFSVVATGNPTPTYQWQQSSNGGSSYTDIASATSANYTTPATVVSETGRLFRVKVSNSVAAVFSTGVALTVSPIGVAPVITLQPGNLSVVVPATATFSVAATGTPTPTYQWQLSTDGGTTYANINAATAASYTTAASTLADSGRKYRAIASNSAGTATSNAATLTTSAGGTTPPGTGGQCSPSNLLTPGLVVQVLTPDTSNAALVNTTTYKVNGTVLFEGHSASEYQVTGISASLPSLDVKLYLSFDTSTSVATAYGSIAVYSLTSGATTIASTSRAVFAPPFVSREFALAPGESTGPQTSVQNVTETTVINGVASPPVLSTQTDITNDTFAGYETITIPAGTFNTCKFVESDISASGAVTRTSTRWALVGYGVDVKNSAGAVAKTVLVNGVVLTHN